MSCRLLLCTDLDRTLIPNGSQAESPGARALFARLVAQDDVVLTYVTGRDASLIAAAIEEYDLPKPQHLVADVGTTILDLGVDGQWSRNLEWHQHIGQDWGEHGRDAIAKQLSRLRELEPQEPARQGRFKLSFYVPAQLRWDELLDTVSTRIARVGMPVTLVHSIDEPRDVGLLDVLPERASKLHAIRFVMRVSGFDTSETLFCGDSGNDLSVLASEIPGVLVANAAEDVRRRAWQLAEQAGTHKQIYIARGGLLGMNGNYAAGIIEGVQHFYPELAAPLYADAAELE